MWPFGKKDYDLFNLFAATATIVLQASAIVKEIVNSYEQMDEKMKKLMQLEENGDQILEQLLGKLNQSFILPFDREDAYGLAQELDSILDYLAGIVDRIVLYKAVQPNPVVSKLAEVLHLAIADMEKAFKLLVDFEHRRKDIMLLCDQITEYERKGDSLYRKAMADLFQGQYDAMTIIKWKEIYEHIETTLDRCEDVAILLRGICIKYS